MDAGFASHTTYHPAKKLLHLQTSTRRPGKEKSRNIQYELTLNEAQGIIQNHPNAFQYDAMTTLQQQLKDPHQQASLMLVGGAAMCATGNPVGIQIGMRCIKESIFMFFDFDNPEEQIMREFGN